MVRILFVEDDELIASGLNYALSQEGYAVNHCGNVHGAMELLQAEVFSLGLLDISLPDGSGYGICKALKEQGVPVIFLTAVDDEGNVVQGLEMGADDYITKPFRLRELLTRIKGVLRRNGGPEDPNAVLTLGPDIHIHTLQARVLRGGKELALTALEYRLLLVFAANRGRVLTRDQLLEGIWDVSGSFVGDNTLTVYIKRLREKLGDDSQSPRLIQTVRGMGYKLNG